MRLRHNYTPKSFTIYKNIYKLPQGSFLVISAADPPQKINAPIQYWSLNDAITKGMATPFTGTTNEAVAGLDSLIA